MLIFVLKSVILFIQIQFKHALKLNAMNLLLKRVRGKQFSKWRVFFNHESPKSEQIVTETIKREHARSNVKKRVALDKYSGV